MHPDPQTIPTPIPKSDPPSLRRPLRLALLRALGRALNSRRPEHGEGRQPPAESRRVLVIRPDHLGDLLFITPALRRLREQLPAAHVTVLVGPWGEPVVAGSPHVDVVQTLEFPGFTRRPQRSLIDPYLLLRAQAQLLRRQNFDTAVILRFDHWWGALLAAWAQIPRRVGYDVPEVRPLVTDAVHYEPARHEVAQNLCLVARAVRAVEPAAQPDWFPLEFYVSAAGEAAAAAFLRAAGVGQADRLAILQPGSGAPVKWWRAEGFARLADALHERWQMKVLIAGADEHALAQQIVARSRAPCINAVGQTTLPQLAALFKRAALAIGVDSGPMHLAVAMGTPSVHLFGPASALKFRPWGDPARHIVLTSGLACIPCGRLDYGASEVVAHPCVRLIAERQVLAAVEALLS